MSISKVIRKRIEAVNGSFSANDNIAGFILDDELDQLQAELQAKIQEVLECLVIDTQNDHNTVDTAKRVAKMYLKEVFKGRYHEIPKATDFPNAKNLDQIYTLGPIAVRSACSHHMVPITGRCWIGVIPSERVIGISKFVRIADWIMSRPQIQEEATVQLADVIEKIIKPRGLAVVVEATHQCMTWRGVKESNTAMTTSVMRGLFRESPASRTEFFSLIGKQA